MLVCIQFSLLRDFSPYFVCNFSIVHMHSASGKKLSIIQYTDEQINVFAENFPGIKYVEGFQQNEETAP